MITYTYNQLLDKNCTPLIINAYSKFLLCGGNNMKKKLRKNSTSLTWRFGAELEGIFRGMSASSMQQACREHLGVNKAPKVIREHQGSNHLEFAFYGANITRAMMGLIDGRHFWLSLRVMSLPKMGRLVFTFITIQPI